MCQDRGSNCKNYAPYCNLPQWQEQLKIECPQSCGFCVNSAAQPTLATIPITADPETGKFAAAEEREDCADAMPTACAASVNLCNKPVYRQNCPMTCGACVLPEHLKPKEGEQKCTDLSDTCVHAKDLCNTPGYRENMENLCPKTCGFACKKISDMMNEIGYVATFGWELD